MWDPTGPGNEPCIGSGFFTTKSSGKPWINIVSFLKLGDEYMTIHSIILLFIYLFILQIVSCHQATLVPLSTSTGANPRVCSGNEIVEFSQEEGVA